MKKLILIAGPCVVENKSMLWNTMDHILKAISKYNIEFIFKASYKKANRTKGTSFRGLKDSNMVLELLRLLGLEYDIPILTDVHSPEEAINAANYVDVLQIPAFLSRQTELLEAAASTGKRINIKKGQFMSAADARFARHKIMGKGYDNIMFTERGTSFGYDDLVIDMRNIPKMQAITFNEVPVIVDVTHSLGKNKGDTTIMQSIANAAVAAGADGIFLETHISPINAMCDGDCMLPLCDLEPFIGKLIKIHECHD
jgi:2-dehydro-3-deoxyphosphooctonate aldolase (KDO 8-P synthase)